MIHVVIGAPCAGKSTYVRENAKSGDVIVDFDAIARALGANGHLPDGDIKQAAFEARKSVIDYCIKSDCEAWIIHTSPTDEQREAYEKANAFFIELDTDMETCLQRARDDNRPDGTEQIIRDYFEAAKAAFFTPRKGASVEYKSFNTTVEEKDGGTVRAYASTFDRIPDAVGDIVAPGAFEKTLAAWRESGKPIPLLWGHDTDDPFSNIGAATDYGTDERGLWFDAAFDAENEKAQYVRKLVKEGRVFQCSFAYAVNDSAPVTLDDGRKVNELRELDLFEISIVQIPANQNATIEEVKSAEEKEETVNKNNVIVASAIVAGENTATIKAGRRNSAKDTDELKRIVSAAEDILSAVNGLLTDDETTTGGEDEREAEEKSEAEGAKSQADFVEAYKQAIKAMYE